MDQWHQVQQLFDSALQYSPEKRQEFLDQKCGSNQKLRLEVESLLAAHHESSSFMAEPAIAGMAEVLHRATSRFQPGDKLGGYTVLDLVGRGGMGEVYRARDTRLKRDVAIKVLPRAYAADRERLLRFEQEARSAAALNHPNIISVHEMGAADGSPYIVSELLEGENLREVLRHGAIPARKALDYAVQAARGLAAAHDAGIIHRDLKPENLFITRDGRLKILDFGLAKLTRSDELGPESGEAPPQTQAGRVFGTLGYMSPEQVRGQAADHRSDIFSFGSILYELFSGKRAFSGDSAADTMSAILREDPPDLTSAIPPVHPAVDRAIRHCLEKNPLERFQSAHDLVFQLQTAENLHPGVGTADGSPSRRRSWFRPLTATRGKLPLTIALIVVVVGAFLYLRGGFHRAKNYPPTPVLGRRSVAVLGFRNLSGRSETAWISTAVEEMLTTELAVGEKLRTIASEDVDRAKADLSIADTESFSKGTLASLHTQLGTDFVVLGSYLALGPEAREVRIDLRLQDATAGETIISVSQSGTELSDVIVRAGAILRSKLGAGELSDSEAEGVKVSFPNDPQVAKLYSEALRKLRWSDALAARHLLRRAVALAPKHPMIHRALAEMWSQLGYDEKAMDEARQALTFSNSMEPQERALVEAEYHTRMGQWRKAAELYGALFQRHGDNPDYGLRWVEAEVEANNPKGAQSVIDTLRHLPTPSGNDPRIDLAEAELANSLGDFHRWQSLASKAVDKAKENGAKHLTAHALVTEASAFFFQDDIDNARTRAEQARNFYIETGDRDGEASASEILGRSAYAKGDVSEALRRFEDSLAMYREIGDKRGMVRALGDMAHVLAGRGDIEHSIKRYSEALALAREIRNKRFVANISANLSARMMDLGELSEALRGFHESLAVAQEIGDRYLEAASLGNLSQIFEAQGDLAGAKQVLTQGLRAALETGTTTVQAALLRTHGAVLRDEDNLLEAQGKYSDAILLQTKSKEPGGVAETRVASAELAINSGHPAEAEELLLDSIQKFHNEHDSDSEITARAVLAIALIEQGKATQANEQIKAAAPLLAASRNTNVKLGFEIATAGVEAITGKSAEAMKRLRSTIALSKRKGYFTRQLNGRLALSKLEIQSGQTVAGRAHLEVLERDARVKGFALIARQASAALKRSQ
jgi:serine/threonine protein kinase/tetratricopeptide (TPR) repeat protein